MRWPLKRSTERLYTPTLVLLIVIVGVSYLGLGFVMPLRALYGREIGTSSAEIGFMASAAMLTGFLTTPTIGWLADRFGHKRILWIGLVLHMLLVLAYIPAQNPLWLIGIRGLEGVAIASVLPPARALVNILAPGTRQAEALGMLSAAQTVGMLIGPAVGALLASQTGYTFSFLLASVPLGLGALSALLFLPRAGQQHQARIAETTRTLPGARLFTPALLLAYLLSAVVSLNNGVGMAVWSLYMQDRGSSLPLIGLSFTTFALPIIILAPLTGRVSDRYGRYWPAIVGLVLSGLVFSLYALPLTPWEIVLISGAEGIPVAISRSAADGLLSDMAPAGAKGKAQANYSAAGNAGSLIAATGAGFLYALAPGAPFLALGVTFLSMGGALFAPGLSRLFTRQSQKAQVSMVPAGD
jgi:MFS family permease